MGRILEWVAFTPYQNATGDPAISLPLATTADGLPQGMMFGAGAGREATLLELAYELEAGRIRWPGSRTDPRPGLEPISPRPARAVYPSPSLAPLAQSAERLHGKEKVYGSIP